MSRPTWLLDCIGISVFLKTFVPLFAPFRVLLLMLGTLPLRSKECASDQNSMLSPMWPYVFLHRKEIESNTCMVTRCILFFFSIPALTSSIVHVVVNWDAVAV